MDRQARSGDTVLVKCREMTALPWWLVGRRGKDDRKQSTLAPLSNAVRAKYHKMQFRDSITEYSRYLVQNRVWSAILHIFMYCRTL
jgi:hypothetical protein